MKRIAVDCGCDKGFPVVLKGAKEALSKYKDLEIILVAGNDKYPGALQNYTPRLNLVKSEYTYNCETKRKIEETSIYKTVELHKNQEVDIVVAPGDTMGSIQTSVKQLGLTKHVKSPAIATTLLLDNVFIDAGANPLADEENLKQYAIMGGIFSKYFLNVKNPKISLANIGTEKGKGRFIRRLSKAERLIDKLDRNDYPLYNNEHGTCYVEGSFLEKFVKEKERGIVVVIDGYSGNLVLKSMEGTSKMVFDLFKEEVKKEPFLFKIAMGILSSRPIKRMFKNLSYDQHCAAPLLGIEGKILIGHGNSESKEIAGAIGFARKYLEKDINTQIKEEIEKYRRL